MRKEDRDDSVPIQRGQVGSGLTLPLVDPLIAAWTLIIMHLMKILLVEDDKLLNHHLSTLLTEAQNQVYSTANAQVALHYAADYPIDVAIIDLGLPDMDGLQLITRLREQQIPFPIIVLTARGNWQDKVEGLEAGADDYLVKPFQKDELLARLKCAGTPQRRLHLPQSEGG